MQKTPFILLIIIIPGVWLIYTSNLSNSAVFESYYSTKDFSKKETSLSHLNKKIAFLVPHYLTWPGPYSYGRGVTVDDEGDVYLSVALTDEFLLIRQDSSGNQLWNHFFNAFGIRASGNQTYLVTFNYKMGIGDVGDCPVLIKLNSAGYRLWSRTWTTALNDYYPVEITSDNGGNIYIMGTGHYSKENNTLVLSKWNSTGHLLWSRNWGTSNFFEVGRGIAVDITGNVYTVGHLFGWRSGIFKNDLVLVKWDAVGNQLWNRTWDYPHDYLENGVTVDSSGNVYTLGTSVTLAKWDATGTQLWNRTESSLKTGFAITVTNDDTIYAIGSTEVGLILVAWDTAGTQLWHSTWLHSTYKEGRIASIQGMKIAVGLDGVVYTIGTIATKWGVVIGEERRALLVIFAPDMDMDNFNDWIENKIGTDPSNSDTDNDGIPDGWEYYLGLNPLDPGDATQDFDGDLVPNFVEYQGDSDPRNIFSFPLVSLNLFYLAFIPLTGFLGIFLYVWKFRKNKG
ncbi:MAG: hypothetical protein ACFFBD_27420 [Candidatus Hodarchaeota archaeon]